MKPAPFNLTLLLAALLAILSACARPLPATEPDLPSVVVEATVRVIPTVAPTLTPTPTPTATPSPEPTPTPARLSLARLKNLHYPLYSQEGWQVPLKDGVYDSDDDWDWPVHVEIDSRSPLFGDLNSDGLEDAVVLLYTQAAASGQFHDLVFVLNRAGEPEIHQSIFLGDDVVVESLAINPAGVTTLKLLSRNPDGTPKEEVREYGPFED